MHNHGSPLNSIQPSQDKDGFTKNEIAMMKARRRKLRQRAKALMTAMEEMGDEPEPFVVLPMQQVN